MLGYSIAERLLITFHSEEMPSAEEWGPYIAFIRARAGEFDNVLVYSLGESPPAQRGDLVKLMKELRKAPRVAMMTPSLFVRAALAAMRAAGLNADTRTFDPADYDGAAKHLALRPDQVAVVRAAVEALHARLRAAR